MAASYLKEYGFDVEFVEKLDRDDIKCAICFMVLREPFQGSKCGHRYCKKCIEEFHEKNPKKCPQDWQDNEWFKDLGKEREILDLKIRCKNHRDGCTWQNELRDQKEHLKTCDFESIQCHLRCGEVVLRENLQNHLDKDCPLISTCEYSDFGCLFKGTRNQLYNHMSQAINQHFSLEMKHEIRNFKKEFNDKLQEKDLKIQKITKEFDAQLKEKDDEIKQLREDVDCAKKDLQRTSNENKENHKAIEETKRDFNRVIDETKIEQQKALNKSMEIMSMMFDIMDKNKHEFTNGSLRERSDHVHNLNKKLAKENKMTLQILRLPQCPYYSFTIENFKTQFEEAKKTNERIFSPSFLTANGYLGYLIIYLNGFGIGQDSHVSVYFQNLKGPYDNSLKWPIPWKSHSFTLLVNSREIGKESSKSSNKRAEWKFRFIRPIGDEGKNFGDPKAFDHKLIDNLTDEDVVAIKYDMDCETQEH